MNTSDILQSASKDLASLSGHVFDLLTIAKPISPSAAANVSKVVSKLSPFLGNLIEFNTVEYLNDQDQYKPFGSWERQDPGFPDAVFRGEISPTPGFEIKAWFPLATEITARFKDSQNHFAGDHTNVCMLAWLPENIIFGRPKIVDVCIVTGKSVAEARDLHYHRPPDYLVLEPENTEERTANLQQTNTAGYKRQKSTREEILESERIVQSWGEDGKRYQPTPEYQEKLRELTSKFNYRLDTNFAKMDRIEHEGIESFKNRVYGKQIHGMSILEWNRLFSKGKESVVRHILQERFGIIEKDTDEIID